MAKNLPALSRKAQASLSRRVKSQAGTIKSLREERGGRRLATVGALQGATTGAIIGAIDDALNDSFLGMDIAPSSAAFIASAGIAIATGNQFAGMAARDLSVLAGYNVGRAQGSKLRARLKNG